MTRSQRGHCDSGNAVLRGRRYVLALVGSRLCGLGRDLCSSLPPVAAVSQGETRCCKDVANTGTLDVGIDAEDGAEQLSKDESVFEKRLDECFMLLRAPRVLLMIELIQKMVLGRRAKTSRFLKGVLMNVLC